MNNPPINKNNNSGNDNSGNYNSGNDNSGNNNSGDFNSGHYNSGWCNSGLYNSGHYNSGDCNSGNYNSGDCNSGFFNTDESTVRCFNKETGIKIEDFRFPNMNGFTLTEFKDGKLVTYDYKEAWKNFWDFIDDNRKSEFASLPNFDSKIFEEITGVKIKSTINKTTLINKINRIKYLKELKTKIDNEILEELNTINSDDYKKLKLEVL